MGRSLRTSRTPSSVDTPTRLLGVMIVLFLLTALVAPLAAVASPALSGPAGATGARTGPAAGVSLESRAVSGLARQAASLGVTLSADPSSVVVNSPVTFAGTVSPTASGPFTLMWSNLPTNCQSSAPSSSSGTFGFTCSPDSPGSSNIQVTASNGTGSSGTASVQLSVYAALSVQASLAPSSLRVNTQLTVSIQIGGGVPPFTLQWSGLPNGCSSAAPLTEPADGSFTFQCNPSQAGSSDVQLRVTDSAMPTSNSASSNPQSLQVNANGGNTGGNNRGSNSNGSNNSGGNLSIPFLNGLGSALSLLFIGAIVLFVLAIITAVSTLVTAIILVRRLPPRARTGASADPTRPCPACGKPVPSATKFCPECGHTMADGKPSPPTP